MSERESASGSSVSSGSRVPTVPGARSVVMSCHDTEMRVQFVGDDLCPFPELKRCYYDAFGKIERMLDFEPTAKEFVDIEEPAFQLLDRDYQIFFEGFSSTDIYEGAIIKVEPVLLKSESEIAVYKTQKEAEEAQAVVHENAERAAKSLRESVLTAAKLKRHLNVVRKSELPISDGPGAVDHEADSAGGSSPMLPAEGNVVLDPYLPGSIPEEASVSLQSAVENRAPLLGQGIDMIGNTRHTGTSSGNGSFAFRGTDHSGSAIELNKLAPKARVPWTEGGIRRTDKNGFSQRMAAYKVLVWTTLDNPLSSNFAAAITLLVIFFILMSTATLVFQTFPNFHHPSQPFGPWFIAETIPIFFFTVEVLARLWSCPTWRTFWFDAFNLIDLMSVMPYYFELIFLSRGAEVPVLLRLMRLIRIFRLIKMSKGSVSVFAETMRSSMRLLYMLLFMVFVSLLVFGSLIYFVERGRWNPLLGVFEQHVYYMCPVLVDLPEEGSRPILYAESSSEKNCQPVWDRFADTGATTMCRYSWKVNDECVSVHSEGAFLSIWHSTWFVMQTISTVGFGDEVPTSAAGICISVVIIIFGMVVVSLPITVIGANFSRTYRGHQRQLWANHELHQYQDLPLLKRIAFNLIYS